jgi:glycosyltransferase involved in cell wall biosynthesis
MTITHVSTGDTLGLPHGSVAVCIPVYGALAMFERCLATVLAHTDPAVPILVADDCTPGAPDIPALMRDTAGHLAVGRRLLYLQQAFNVGFVRNVNDAFDVLAPADVVIVNSDVEVAAGWLDGMLDAASEDVRVATVSTLTNHGSIVSVPDRNEPTAALPDGMGIDEAAARVRGASLGLHPRIPVAIGHCVLIRRSALDLVGAFDLAFSPGYGEEVDFSLRCAERGLVHVVADDVLVLHHGGASFGGGGKRTQGQHDHDVLVNNRYPYFPAWVGWVSNDLRNPLGRAIAAARSALVPLSVTIDARCLGSTITGTQLHALELIGALHRTGRVTLRVVLPRHPGAYAVETLTTLDGVEILDEEGILDAGRTDIVHRPYQVGHDREIFDLAHLGRRLIVTFQDMIAYNAPSYFPTVDHYFDYLRVTHDVFAYADRMIFFSPHAQTEARRIGALRDDRTDVVLLGADHSFFLSDEPTRPVALPDEMGDSPFMLCLGTNFQHKNRVFALRILHEMRERYGWEGNLVFAGPHVSEGGSVAEEAAFLREYPGLAERVVDIEAVDEAGKAWLLREAGVVVYPTTLEGFGLVPLEASEAGTPCLFAPVASLRDLFDEHLALITPWDAAATAANAMQVLDDPAVRDANVQGLREAAARLQWDRTADEMLAAYARAVDDPRPRAGDNAVRAMLHEWEISRLRTEGTSSGSLLDQALASPEEGIPDEIKRATLAIAYRPWLRKPIFGAVRVPYRMKARLTRRTAGPGRDAGH